PGLTVIALDTVKGAVGIMLAHMILPHQITFGVYILIGFLAVAGHTFSIFLRFKGGKGVATSLGVLLALSWPVGAIAFAVWLICVAVTRYVSIASMAAGISLPFGALCTMHGDDRWWMAGLGAVLAIMVVIKHRANIQRLLAGTESKIGQRVKLPSKTVDELPASETETMEVR
ncbi:MAG TPA: glycerol-3-phosphate acyltransferase, partial [Armatimonadota bacterium]|nr:glycerol-3-phosphate acyltransferase [Armatimonadota bacterium]